MKRAKRICLPADKNDEDPLAVGQPERLVIDKLAMPRDRSDSAGDVPLGDVALQDRVDPAHPLARQPALLGRGLGQNGGWPRGAGW